MNRLLLIDGNSLIYRAYYATSFAKNNLSTSFGQPTNAVHAFGNMFISAITKLNPTHILVAFDAAKKTRRHEKYAEYKEGRKSTPPELISQFPLIKEMLIKMGVKIFESIGWEADDIIASVSNQNSDTQVKIMSSDKDLFQLVSNNVSILINKVGISTIKEYNIDNFKNLLGYLPNQVPDMKGIVGDPSDNLPGVKGIGEKGAIKLIDKYGSLENIYANIENIQGAIKEKLIKSEKTAKLCKELATLIYDIEIPYSFNDLQFKLKENEELLNFFNKYEMKSLRKKVNIISQKSRFNNILF